MLVFASLNPFCQTHGGGGNKTWVLQRDMTLNAIFVLTETRHAKCVHLYTHASKPIGRWRNTRVVAK